LPGHYYLFTKKYFTYVDLLTYIVALIFVLIFKIIFNISFVDFNYSNNICLKKIDCYYKYYISWDRCSMADSQVQHGILRCMQNNEQRVNQTAISMHFQRCNNKTQVPIYATKHLGTYTENYLL
jgi:hypothetical protein